MIRIDIRPVWRFRVGHPEREFDFQLIAILAELDELAEAHACGRAARASPIATRGTSSSEWEAFFGAPLVTKSKGRGSRLTPLGKRLLWAGPARAGAPRARARQPRRRNSRAALNESLAETPPSLVVHASHDFAIGGSARHARRPPIAAIGLQYKGSFDALASLRRGECDVAGFHVPEGPLGALMAQRYAECLPSDDYRPHRVRHARRRGSSCARGNPKEIAGVRGPLPRRRAHGEPPARLGHARAARVPDLLAGPRPLAHAAATTPKRSPTARSPRSSRATRPTWASACEAAAAQYRLDFLPLCRERYYLACRAADLGFARHARARRHAEGRRSARWCRHARRLRRERRRRGRRGTRSALRPIPGPEIAVSRSLRRVRRSRRWRSRRSARLARIHRRRRPQGHAARSRRARLRRRAARLGPRVRARARHADRLDARASATTKRRGSRRSTRSSRAGPPHRTRQHRQRRSGAARRSPTSSSTSAPPARPSPRSPIACSSRPAFRTSCSTAASRPRRARSRSSPRPWACPMRGKRALRVRVATSSTSLHDEDRGHARWTSARGVLRARPAGPAAPASRARSTSR